MDWAIVCHVEFIGTDPANTKHLYNIYAMPAQRLRRWSSIV